MGTRCWKTRPLQSGYLIIDPDTLFWCVVDSLSEIDSIHYSPDMQSILRNRLCAESTRIKLKVLELHLTERCNLRCTYCYVPTHMRASDTQMSSKVLETTMRRTIEYADQEGFVPLVLVHGGEPLICKDQLWSLIDLYRSEIKFAIQTNGTLLDPEDIDFLTERGVSIGLSLDGILEYNDRTRMFPDGSGTFQAIDSLLDRLKGYEDVGIITAVTSRNVEGLAPFMHYLHDKEVTSVTLNPVSPENAGARALVPSLERLTSNYIAAICTCLEMNDPGNFNHLVIDNVEAILTNILSDNRPVFCHMSPCGAGRLNLVVTADGDMWPCSGFIGRQRYRCGNVLNNSFSSALYSKPCIELRGRNVDMIDGCSNCVYKHICGANCPLPLLDFYGSWDKPSVYCDFMQQLIDYLFSLLAANLGQCVRLLSVQRRVALARAHPLAIQWD